jgi:hypothetical protein
MMLVELKECRYPKGKARNSTRETFKGKKMIGITFVLTFVCLRNNPVF